MKPDLITCNNCGKPIPKGKWCSDKCRMAYKRTQPEQEGEQTNNPNTNKPEQMKPEQAKVEQPEHDEFRATLTKTDRTFYDRAMRDFKKPDGTPDPYYNFGEKAVAEKVCDMGSCGVTFKTTLSLLRYCSYQHYSESLGGKG